MCSPSCLFLMRHSPFLLFFFFFNDTATTEIYTLSLHDALPIWNGAGPGKLLPHAAHDVADRGGERYRHGDFGARSEEHTSELQSLAYLVCRLLLEKKKKKTTNNEASKNLAEHNTYSLQ